LIGVDLIDILDDGTSGYIFFYPLITLQLFRYIFTLSDRNLKSLGLDGLLGHG